MEYRQINRLVRVRFAAALCAAGLALASAGCGEGGEVSTSGTLAEPADAADAVTYTPDLAPAGATMTVTAREADGSTTVELSVAGFEPDRGYAAHAHTDPCGKTGDAAGPHFQHEQAPEDASEDPAYANPRNEIWLDLRTDADGSGMSSAEVPFVFEGSAPASVVVHAEPKTATAEGEAGAAGDRVACLTVPFE